MPNLPEQSAANDKFDFPTNGAPEPTWGDLTAYAILRLDSDWGELMSDPPPDYDPDRVGLANVVEEGNIFATVEQIDSLLL